MTATKKPAPKKSTKPSVNGKPANTKNLWGPQIRILKFLAKTGNRYPIANLHKAAKFFHGVTGCFVSACNRPGFPKALAEQGLVKIETIRDKAEGKGPDGKKVSDGPAIRFAIITNKGRAALKKLSA